MARTISCVAAHQPIQPETIISTENTESGNDGIPRQQFPCSILVTFSPTRPTRARHPSEDATRTSRVSGVSGDFPVQLAVCCGVEQAQPDCPCDATMSSRGRDEETASVECKLIGVREKTRGNNRCAETVLLAGMQTQRNVDSFFLVSCPSLALQSSEVGSLRLSSGGCLPRSRPKRPAIARKWLHELMTATSEAYS